jgi:hypothetical protein
MALARWKKHREKPVDPEILADLDSYPPISEGDAIGSLEWRNFRTGKVMRWTVLRGDRVDRVILRHPDGRKTQSHGWDLGDGSFAGVLRRTKDLKLDPS